MPSPNDHERNLALEFGFTLFDGSSYLQHGPFVANTKPVSEFIDVLKWLVVDADNDIARQYFACRWGVGKHVFDDILGAATFPQRLARFIGQHGPDASGAQVGEPPRSAFFVLNSVRSRFRLVGHPVGIERLWIRGKRSCHMQQNQTTR